MRSQAHRAERPSFLEVAVALTVMVIVGLVVIAVGWFGLTVWWSAIQYMESAVR